MSAIRWEDLFYVNLTTGEVSDEAQDGYVAFPMYGNYGGAFNPDEELLTKPNGDPYSYKQLVKLGDATQVPADISDYLYYLHDWGSANAGSATEQAQADINLIQSLTLTDTSFDAEASLYDGVVTLAMIGRLAINDQLDEISPTLLLAAVTDAANDIEYGLQNLPFDEQTDALEAIFGPSDDGIFQLAFTFPSIPGAIEVVNEGVEFAAITAVAGAINEPLQGDIVPPTLFGDDYILQFDRPNSDLDILLA